MNPYKTIYYILLLVILSISTYMISNIYSLLENKSNFYEHNNTKINLLQVKKISTRVVYSDSNKHYNAALSEEEIMNIEKFLLQTSKKKFYNIQLSISFNFDNQVIQLYQSPRYLKLPKTYTINPYMLETLQTYGLDAFQYKSLQKLQDKMYKNKKKFVDDVITFARLKRNAWSENLIPLLGLGKDAHRFMQSIQENEKEHTMEVEDINIIILELHKARNKYLRIK